MRTIAHVHAEILNHAHANARAPGNFLNTRTRTHAHAKFLKDAHARARENLEFFGTMTPGRLCCTF